jgi:septal ring factor EnvC (AmiA/AmiB activator)
MTLERLSRDDAVVQYLRASITKLVARQFRSGRKTSTLDPGRILSRLVAVLHSALSSEREHDLENLMVKLTELRSEKSRLENERLQFQRQAERTAQRDLEENSQLEHECA